MMGQGYDTHSYIKTFQSSNLQSSIDSANMYCSNESAEIEAMTINIVPNNNGASYTYILTISIKINRHA